MFEKQNKKTLEILKNHEEYILSIIIDYLIRD